MQLKRKLFYEFNQIFSNINKNFRLSASIASSGSCAILAHIRRNHLHVANVGDSAAILGYVNHGNLTSRQLSRAHTVENPDEVFRIRSEHPISEFNSILRGKNQLNIALQFFVFRWSFVRRTLSFEGIFGRTLQMDDRCSASCVGTIR